MAGRLTNIVYPDGYQLNYAYNGADLIHAVTDSAGHSLEFGYVQIKGKPKISYVLSAGLALVENEYDEYGRLISSTDRNGVTVTNAYDFLDRLVARRSVNGSDMTGLETFEYDARGLTNSFDALGHLTTFVRDSVGRVLYETNANNEVLRFTYDAAGHLLTLTDGKDQTTEWRYDEYGRVTNKVDAALSVIFAYKYDPLDRLTNRWSAAKGNTIYKYDPIGNLTNVAYVNSSNIVLSYDDLNRLTSVTDGVGTTVFTWTDGDQLASEDGPWPFDTINYTYTNRLRASLSLEAPNASPWTQSYGYDQHARLTSLVSPAGSFNYSYWDNGYPSDRVYILYQPIFNGVNPGYIANSYDGLMRLTDTRLYSPWIGDVSRHQYGYDAGSQRTQQVFTVENVISHYANYTYDHIGQLKTAKGFEADHTPRLHEQFGYAYDKAWNLSYRTNNALTQIFNVNNLNELTAATRSGTLTVAGTATEHKADGIWFFDGVTNVTVSGTGLASGAADLYWDGAWARTNATLANGNNTYTATAYDTYGRTAEDSVTVNLPATNIFVYDLNGNLRTNNTRIFDYDDENQLICITEPGAWKSEFAYDHFLRRRVRKEYAWNSSAWTLTNEVRYVYDGMLVVQERNGNNLALVSYTRGNDLSGDLQAAGGVGGLLARTDNFKLHTTNPEQASAYYHCDGNGNVTAMVNTSGQIVARYKYDSYGNLLDMSGSLTEANAYRFSSKEWHSNAELYYYGFRYYEPNLQRWQNRDPIAEKGGVNLYGFVENSPIYGIDAFGHRLWYCTTPTTLFNGIGRHGYIWNDDPSASGGEQICSQEGGFGIRIGAPTKNTGPIRGKNDEGLGKGAGCRANDDIWNGTQPPYEGKTRPVECIAIPGTDDDQKNKDIMTRCSGRIDNYPWMVCLWDCHVSARLDLRREGLTPPPYRRWNSQPPFGFCRPERYRSPKDQAN